MNWTGNEEWLEADGLGGFASGMVDGIRTRRYHGLLLTAQTPPTGRIMLVNGFEAWVQTPTGTFFLTSQHYAPDVVYPEGSGYLEAFEPASWSRFWNTWAPPGSGTSRKSPMATHPINPTAARCRPGVWAKC